jgi:hypothetical protein
MLAGLKDHRHAVRRIVEKISRLGPEESSFYARTLLTLAGLRGLEEAVAEEVKHVMAIELDELLVENKVLGPIYQAGELNLLRGQIEHRFGSVPSWVEEHLVSASHSDLQEISRRILDARTLEDLFPSQ